MKQLTPGIHSVIIRGEKDIMAIRYNTIIENSFVDGPGGPRVVLVTQGCSIRCEGCQNKELWPAYGEGNPMAPMPMASHLLQRSNRITVTGGEPTDQPQELWNLMVAIRSFQDSRKPAHVIIYTGRRFEDFFTEDIEATDQNFALAALLMADTVVDGPFIAEQDDDRLQWRGSRNQRSIDIGASVTAARANGQGAGHLPRYLVLEDWDTPTLMITDEGIVGAAGLIRELTETQEEASATRRCGEF